MLTVWRQVLSVLQYVCYIPYYLRAEQISYQQYGIVYTNLMSKEVKAFHYTIVAKKVSKRDVDAKIVSKGTGVRDSVY